MSDENIKKKGTSSKNGVASSGAKSTRQTSTKSNGSASAPAANKKKTDNSRLAAERERKRREEERLLAEELERIEAAKSVRDEICVILILLLCTLMYLSFFGLCGKLGNIISLVVFGLFGLFGYVFPIALFFTSVFAVSNRKNRLAVPKVIYCVLLMIGLCGLIQLIISPYKESITLTAYFTNSAKDFIGLEKTYGGFMGGLLVKLLCPFVGRTASIIILLAFNLIMCILIAGKAVFSALARNGAGKLHDAAERKKQRRIEEAEYEQYAVRRDDEIRESRQSQALDSDEAMHLEHVNETLAGEVHGKRNRRGAFSNDPEELEKYLEEQNFEREQGKKGSFIDGLMRRGMGLESDRISQAPEYKDLFDDIDDADLYGVEEAQAAVTNQPDEKPESVQRSVFEPEPVEKNATDTSQKRRFSFGRHTTTPEQHFNPDKNENRVFISDVEPEEEEQSNIAAFSPRKHAFRDFFENGEEEKKEDSFADYTLTDIPEDSIPEPLGKEQQDNSETEDTSEAVKVLEFAARRHEQDSIKQKPSSNHDGSQVNAAQPQVKERTSSGATAFTDVSAAVNNLAEEKPLPAYYFPPLELLKRGDGKTTNADSAELEGTVDKLQRTFESFGVKVTVTNATCGPTVTRYELMPDQGVKVKAITALSDDIKLALAAPEIRIEAPIPGKAAVGIEVPNAKTSPVFFGDLIASKEFSEASSNLTFAVGKDIGGRTICSDIAGMPHLLIAGATGSGKSVCINALIMSILYKASPNDVRMIMIDPKRVELTGYNGIPHLLVPVVTDVKKASGALNWAIAEMDDRYSRFADVGVNNLASYNRFVEEKYYEEGNDGECPNRLPQILLIVDELNDLMMTANAKEVEAAICRLTQLARASGIHVVLATQRPSVNVITGTIKANIPSRIAFSVSSLVDSRTIIDQGGAEKLLGKGDMLFSPQGYPKPVRVQGAYVSDKEVAEVVAFIKEKCQEVKYSELISKHIDEKSAGAPAEKENDSKAASAPGSDRDEFFVEAGRFIIEKNKSSIGTLQRVFKIGFNRAARIMDQLAEEGVVGPEEGTKPRRILMTKAQFEAYINGEATEPETEAEAEETEEF